MFFTFVAVALAVIAWLYSKAYEETGDNFFRWFFYIYLVLATAVALYAGMTL